MPDSSLMKQAKSFTAGGLGGIALVFVGHPLDTIKVRMQAAPMGLYSGMVDCTTKSIARDGLRGLYAGIGAPLAAQPPMFAAYFWGYEVGSQICQMVPFLHRDDGSIDGYIPAVLFAGGFSALPGTAVMVPGERVKIAMQMQAEGINKTNYRGSWHAARSIIADHGLFAGLYKGTLATLARDIPGSIGWYGAYELVKSVSKNEDGSISKLAIMNAGGFAGFGMWGVATPADVIKTRFQNAAPGQYPGGLTQIIKELIAKEGIVGIYRGIGPALVRAYPANAACFLTNDLVKDYLRDDDIDA